MSGRQTLAQPSAGALAVRGAAARVAGFLAGQILTIGAIALLFRHLGVADSGRYVTVLSLVAIVGGLTDLGLTTLTVRELSAGADRALIGRTLGLRLVATGAGLVLVAAFALVAGYPRSMVAGVAIAGVGLLAQNVAATLACELLVALRAGRVAAADLVRQIVAALALAAGVAAGFGLVGFFVLIVPGAVAGLAVVAWGVRSGKPARSLRPSLVDWRSLLRATAPFAVAAAASVLFFRVALVELSVIGDARETGLFAASFRVVEVLAVLPALAVSTVFPLFSSAVAGADRVRLGALVARWFEACAAVGGALALGLALGAPVVIGVVAGSSFDDAVNVLRIQGFALLFSFLAATWAFALLALRRERALMWINVAGVVLASGVGAALIAWQGAEGAALATVIGEAGLAVAFAIVLVREDRGLAPSVTVLGRVVVAGGLGASASLLPVSPVVMAAAGLGVYGVSLYMLGLRPWQAIGRV